MNWLNDYLYSTDEEQNMWDVNEWRDVWAQLMRVLNNALIEIDEDKIKCETDLKRKHYALYMLKLKKYADKQVRSWEVSRMSKRMIALITADLMQRHKYRVALKMFPNLKLIDGQPILDQTLVISENDYEPFIWYHNMNVKV